MNSEYTKVKFVLIEPGITANGFEITKEAIINSLDTFTNAPVIYNPNGDFKDYRNKDDVKQLNTKVVGTATDIEMDADGTVYGYVIFTDDRFSSRTHYDNWQIELKADRRQLKYTCAEVWREQD